MDDELRKIMECTCLRMRRATRLVTQLYDHALGPSGLTVSQFGLLAYLLGEPGAVERLIDWNSRRVVRDGPDHT